MRDFEGTKDNHQREEEEAERLVRPNPKKKPPRRDLRRENMETERDSDTAGDPDLKGDPDLSMNYKTIGGSVSDRVAARFLRADVEPAPEDENGKGGVPARWQEWLDATKGGGKKKVPNPNAETRQKSPSVSYSTALKIPAFFQEALKDYRAWAEKTEEEGTPSKPAAPEQTAPTSDQVEPTPAPGLKPSPTTDDGSKADTPEEEPQKAPAPGASKDHAENGRLLRELGTQNMLTGIKLKHFFTGELGHMAEVNPAFPAKPLFPEVDLPPGIKTIGDMAEALKAKPAKAPKPEAKPESSGEPPSPAPKTEAPKAEAPKGDPSAKPPAAEDALGDKIKNFIQTLPEDQRPMGELFTQFLQTMKDQKAPPSSGKPEEAPPVEKPEAPKAPTKKAPVEPWPGRRAVDKREIEQAQTLIGRALPGRVAAKFMGLHPDDARQLVAQYDSMKQLGPLKDSDLDASISKMKSGFTLDPKEVPAPKTWKKGGKEVPFASLTPEEQATATQSHQLQVVAYNISLRERAIATLKGRGVSSSIAAQTIDSQISKPKVGNTPEEQVKIAAEREDTIKKAATNNFVAGVASKDPPMSPAERERALSGAKTLPPETKRLAYAQLQADDYRAVMAKYLRGGDSQLSEHDAPKVFKAKLNKALKEFEDRASSYPEDVVRDNPQPERIFRAKLLSKLEESGAEALYGEVSKYFASLDADHYDKDVKGYEKLKSQFEKDSAQYVKEFEAWKSKKSSETPPDPPKEPKPPVMPDGYYETRRSSASQGAGGTKEQIEAMLRRSEEEDAQARKGDEKAEELLGKHKDPSEKTAHRSPYSSYGYRDLTMGSPMPEFESRDAVYHGAEPPKGSDYAGWQQAHVCDMGPSDNASLIAAAKEWLKSPVLSKSIEGMLPDSRFRAALDLAIRDASEGKYSGAVNASLYNELLSKLSGDHSEPLGTIGREASLRSDLRKVALDLVEVSPGLAYDLLSFADRPANPLVASVETPKAKKASVDDTYEALRSTVIRVASEDPSLRSNLLPVLRLIKTIDDVRTLRTASNGD